jgi:hypothetical protein
MISLLYKVIQSIFQSKALYVIIIAICINLFSTNKLFAQADACASATALTVGTSCVTTSYNVTGTFTNDGPTPCSGTSHRDGWYTFTTGVTTTAVTITGTSNRQMGLAIYSGTCGSLSQVACIVPGASGATLNAIVSPSTTYRLRIMRTNNATANDMTGTICVYSIPAYDICNGAISLSPNTTCTPTTGSTTSATDNNETGDCTIGTENSVWYRFTATATSHVVTVDGITGFDPVLNVISACGTITAPSGGSCVDATGDGGVESTTLTGLTIGNSYYVQVHDFQGDQTANGFTICVTTPSTPTPPTNDACAGATALPCATNNLAGTTVNSVSESTSPVTSYASPYGVWYSFTGDGQSTTISSTATFDHAMVIVSGSCGTLTYIDDQDAAASGGTETYTFTTVSSIQYYVYIAHYSTSSTTTGTFTISRTCTAAPTPPANNDCGGAVSLTVNSGTTCTSTTTGTTVAATQSQAGCSGTADDDVWYSFTATATSHTITVTPTTLSNAVLEVFSGTCGGSFISLGCQNITSGSTAESLTLTGLTATTTYFVRVHSNANGTGQGTFTMCVTTPPPPPANDACAGATSLPCATSSLAGTTVNSISETAPSGCASNYGVWYTFTGDGQSTTISSTATFDHEMDFFSGSCGTLTNIACIDDVSGSESYTFTTINGTNYFVYIAHYSTSSTTTGTFTISRTCTAPPTPPANDNCSAATAFPAVPTNGTCATLSNQSTALASNSGVTPTGYCTSNSGNPDDDVWFSFVASAAAIDLSATYVSGASDLYWQVFSGACGASMTSIYCSDFNDAGFSMTGLTIGQTYYIRLYTYAASASTIQTLCLSTPYNPCASVTNISDCAITQNPTIAGGTGGYGTSSCGFSTPGKEVIYTFTPTTTGVHTINQASSFDYIDYQYKTFAAGCSSTGWTCIDDLSGASTSSGFPLVAGTQYYIMLDPESATGGAVSFSINCPTVGAGDDECIGATSLTPGAPGATCAPTAGSTLTGYTESAYGCLNGYPDDDIWYSFVATANSHTVTVDGAANFDAVLAVFSSSDCINFTDVTGGDCIDNSLSDGIETAVLTGLTIGATYYVNVYDWWDNSLGYNNGGDFTVCVTTPGPPPNDDCAAAISISPTGPGVACSPTAGTTVGGSDSGVGCDDGNEDDDVWYSFTASATSHVVTVNGGAGFRAVVGVYTNCGATVTATGGACVTAPGANDEISLTLTALNIGTTYFVKLHDRSAGGATFTICVTTPDNICPDGPPLNDEPCNAVEVTLGSIASGNNACATTSNEPAAIPSCWTTGTRNTVWYSFLAPASGSVKIRTAPGTLVNTQIAAYSGTCGSGLTQIASACNNDAPNCGGTTLTISELTLTGLTNGVRYYVSVDGTNNNVGSFAITIVNGSAAYPSSSGQECSVPITVCNTEINVGDPGYQGIGFTCDANSSIVNCTTGERGSAWYKIDISANGTLLFDIIPNDYDGTYGTETDYDFVLWKVTGSGSTTCSAINSSGGDNEIACNYSADGVTGLSTDGNAPSEYPSFGSAYETGITVIAGESYLLAVQNYSNSTSGFTLDFKNTAPGVINTSTPSSVTWTGGNNSSIWDNTVNWGGCSTPTCGINGIVSPSSAFQPTVTAAMGTVNVRNLTIDPGATLTLGPNAVIQICENLTNNGTIVAHPTSSILFNDNTTTHSVNGTLSGSSSLGNLTITDVTGSTNCTVVANTDIEITGNFTTTNATSIFNLNGNNLLLNGNFTNAAGSTTFTNTANSTLFFNGNTLQTYSPNSVSATPSLTLNNVVMNNSSTGVTISTTNTPNMILGTTGILTLNAGKIVTPGNQEVTITNTANTAVSTGNTSSYIEGNLRRNLASGALGSFDFPVGNTALGYQRANINFTSPAAAFPMNLLAKFNSWGGAWPLPGAPGWGPECFVYYNVEYLDNGYWTIDASETSTGTYNASLYNRGFTNAGAASGWSIAKSPTSGPNWALNGLCSPTPSPTPVIRTGMTGFSNFSTIQSVSPLPVEMASFNVVCDNGNGLISWSTVSELNSKEFVIERSEDGIIFERIATVTAAGNSNSLKYYAYTNYNILSGRSYYRLKIVGLDQSYKYTVLNELNCEETETEISVFYSEELGIIINTQLSASADYQIDIFDVLGKKINSTSKRLDSGSSITFINTEGVLANGVYLIRINKNNGTNVLTKKLFVK